MSNKNHKTLLEQYIGEEKGLAYLSKEYNYIAEQLASEGYPKQIGRRLSGLLLYWLRQFGKKRATRLVKKVFNKLEKNKDNNGDESEMLELISSYVSALEEAESTRRYDNFELEKYPNLIELHKPAWKEKNETRTILAKLQRDLNNYQQLLLPGKIDFIDSKIRRDEIDKIARTLAELARNLLQHYRLQIGGAAFEGYWRWRDYEHWHYWVSRGHTIGYIYILSNDYMPGLVKIGKTERVPHDRRDELSRFEGVPGNFQIEYERATVLDYNPVGDAPAIERMIHKKLRAKLLNDDLTDGVCDLFTKEFFVVPSVRYAILFVEKELDAFDEYLSFLEVNEYC